VTLPCARHGHGHARPLEGRELWRPCDFFSHWVIPLAGVNADIRLTPEKWIAPPWHYPLLTSDGRKMRSKAKIMLV